MAEVIERQHCIDNAAFFAQKASELAEHLNSSGTLADETAALAAVSQAWSTLAWAVGQPLMLTGEQWVATVEEAMGRIMARADAATEQTAPDCEGKS